MGQYQIGRHLYARDGDINEGEVVPTHAHTFDHPTFITKGAALIERLASEDGPVVDSCIRRASDAINYANVEAGVFHRITGLEDGTRYMCLYSLYLPGGEVVPAEVAAWHSATR